MTPRIVVTERRLTAIVRAAAPFDQLPQVQRTSRAALAAALPSLGAGTAGPTCTRWTPPEGGKLPMEIGTIVSHPFAAKGGVELSELPAGRAAHYVMKGSFEGLPNAWKTLFDWCAGEELKLAGLNWEIYGAEQDAELYALLA